MKLVFLTTFFILFSTPHVFAEEDCNKDNFKEFIYRGKNSDKTFKPMWKKSYYKIEGVLQQPYIRPRHCNLQGIDFSNRILAEYILDNGQYVNHPLKTKTIKNKYNWDGATLTDVNFDRANLNGTDFFSAMLGNTSFKEANLTNARRINLKSNATVQKTRKQVDFEGANLKNAVFGTDYVEQINTLDVNFKNVKGQGARIEKHTFTKNTFFENADFTEADFSGSDFRLVPDLHKATVTGANFTDAMVTQEQAKFLRSKGISGFYVKGGKKQNNSPTECTYNGELVFVDLGSCGQYCYGQAQCKVKGFNAKFGVHCKTSGGECPKPSDCALQKEETAGVQTTASTTAPSPPEQKKGLWDWLCFFCSDDDSSSPSSDSSDTPLERAREAGGDRSGGTK